MLLKGNLVTELIDRECQSTSGDTSLEHDNITILDSYKYKHFTKYFIYAPINRKYYRPFDLRKFLSRDAFKKLFQIYKDYIEKDQKWLNERLITPITNRICISSALVEMIFLELLTRKYKFIKNIRDSDNSLQSVCYAYENFYLKDALDYDCNAIYLPNLGDIHNIVNVLPEFIHIDLSKLMERILKLPIEILSEIKMIDRKLELEIL